MGEVKFRGGKRVVPDYMEQLMAGIPTHKMTYDEAVVAMNAKMERGVIDQSFDKIVARHFVENRVRGSG